MSVVVKSFLKIYPKVNLHVEYSKGAQVYEDCLHGVIDLGIVPYPEARKGLRTIPLPADKLVMICAPEHPLAQRRYIDIKELNEEKFIAFERGLASQRAIERIFQENEVKVKVVMEFDNIETIKRSVEIAAGVSIVPFLSVQKEVENGNLAQILFTDRSFYRPLGIIVRRKHSLSRAARKFIELMQKPQMNA
jgi:DNA-binding transcriptional LysR family regulator